MHILLFDIPYLSSLINVQETNEVSGFIDDIYQQLTTIPVYAYKRWKEQIIFVYDFPSNTINYYLFRNIQQIQKKFEQKREIFYGFYLYFEIIDNEETDRCHYYKQKILNDVNTEYVQDGLYLGKEAYATLVRGMYIPSAANEKKRWYFANTLRLDSNNSVLSMANYFQNDACISYIHNEIGYRIDKKVSAATPIVIRGPGVAGVHQNIERALHMYYHGTNVINYLHIWGVAHEDSCLVPFANSLSEEIITQLTPFINPQEQKIIDTFKESIAWLLTSSDYYTNYGWDINNFITIYRIVFSAFCRYSKRKGLPTIIYLHNVHLFNKEVFEILTMLMTSIGVHYDAILVMGCHRLPHHLSVFFSKFSVYTLRAPAITRVQHHIKACIPEHQIAKRNISGNSVHLYYQILAGQLNRLEKETAKLLKLSMVDLLGHIIRCISPTEREMLFTIYLLSPYYSMSLVKSIMIEMRYSEDQIQSTLDTLIEMGLVVRTHRALLRGQEVRAAIQKVQEKGDIGTFYTLSNLIYTQWELGNIPCSYGLQKIAKYCNSISQVLALMLSLISFLSVREDTALLSRLLNKDMSLMHTLTNPAHFNIQQLLLCAGRIRLAILKKNTTEASRLIKTCGNRVGMNLPHGYLNIERARYYCFIGNYQKAIAMTVQAILIYQKHSFNQGIVSAYNDCGYYYMATNNFSSAKHYLEIAAEHLNVHRTHDIHLVRNQVLKIILEFLAGNYSKVGVSADSFMHNAPHGAEEWVLYVLFIKGKTLFELGCYTQSLKVFQEGEAQSSLYQYEPASNLFKVWIGRAKVYLNGGKKAIDFLTTIAENRERNLYIAEGYVRLQDYTSALHYIETESNTASNNSQKYNIDKPSWDSGYSYIQGGKAILNHQIQAMKSYVRGKNGNHSNSTKMLHNLIKLENISKIDPYISIYYLWLSQIVHQKNSEEAKLQEILLGRSLKFLYNRLNRIDNSNDRTHYLDNYWNKQVINQARNFRLIS